MRKVLSHKPPADSIARANFLKGIAFQNAQGQKNLLSFLALRIRENPLKN